MYSREFFRLNYFQSMLHFYTPWIHQKNSNFQGVKKWHIVENGLIKLIMLRLYSAQKSIRYTETFLNNFVFIFLWTIESHTLTTIRVKNCEAPNLSPFKQCWLRVCLLIADQPSQAWLFQAWHNIKPVGRKNSGYLQESRIFFGTF